MTVNPRSPRLKLSPEAEAQVPSENRAIAAKLREGADLLQAQGANPFRVGAYRKAADTLSQLSQPVRYLFDEKGREGLEALPGIGRGLASSIAEMLITGRWAQLQRLRGETDPEKLFQVVQAGSKYLIHVNAGDRRASNIVLESSEKQRVERGIYSRCWPSRKRTSAS